jgi:hypothetical protein
MKKTWKHSWAAAIFGATAFVTTSTSQANVIVYWEEVTKGSQTDVVATWTGHLDPGTFKSDGVRSSSMLGTGGNAFLAMTGGTSYDKWSSSNPTTDTGLALEFLRAGEFELTGADVLGFDSGPDFHYSGIDDDQADTSLIDFDSTLHSMTIPNTTLAGMNADGFSNTLAWTSDSGDTISYTTGSPPTVSAIPEPSSGLVLGFLLLSGLIHRRRK